MRGGLRSEDERQPGGFGSGAAPFRDVVLGLNSTAPNDTVMGFAFEAASQRAARLRVVHGRSPELPYYDNGGDLNAELHDELTGEMHRALAEALEPWRHKFPGVEVTEQAVIGKAGSHLVEASRDASLVVVGRHAAPDADRPGHPRGAAPRHRTGRGGPARLTCHPASRCGIGLNAA